MTERLELPNVNEHQFPYDERLRALDVGTAEGANAIALKRRGYEVCALEIDAALLTRFRRKPEAMEIEIVQGDALAIPFRDRTFDRTLLIEVVEHIVNTEQLLREINRVMKVGGILCVGVPTAYTERLYWRLNPRYSANATHVKIFSLSALRAQLHGAGFKINAIETKNFIPAVQWFFHALLRSDSDHTGAIYSHLWIDRWLERILLRCSRTFVLGTLYSLLSRAVGKSWYLYCEKIA